MLTAIEQRIPPLVAGDKLTRAEFLRRWEAHPEIKNAELIGAIVYISSPVSAEHGDMDGDVGGWLFTYRMATPGTAAATTPLPSFWTTRPRPISTCASCQNMAAPPGWKGSILVVFRNC
jgi:hypothetical protein